MKNEIKSYELRLIKDKDIKAVLIIKEYSIQYLEQSARAIMGDKIDEFSVNVFLNGELVTQWTKGL